MTSPFDLSAIEARAEGRQRNAASLRAMSAEDQFGASVDAILGAAAGDIRNLLSEQNALIAEVRKLREALEPFAGIDVSPDYSDEARFKLIHVLDKAFTSLSAGDLRRARAALTPTKGE